jgi:hypothetical protein
MISKNVTLWKPKQHFKDETRVNFFVMSSIESNNISVCTKNPTRGHCNFNLFVLYGMFTHSLFSGATAINGVRSI